MTWTSLGATAVAGADMIVTMDTVDWQAGDVVVITTSGNSGSQGQSELRYLHMCEHKCRLCESELHPVAGQK